MTFYRLLSRSAFQDRWYLGDLNIDIQAVWKLREGGPLDLTKYRDLHVEIDQPGIPLDFTETDGDNVPIVSEEFAECLYDYMGEIELLPVSIPNAKRPYYVMVIKTQLDCVDEAKSDFLKFEEGNEIRPDLAGQYQVINVLTIDPSKVDKNIFRLAKYNIVILVSEPVKNALESKQLTGLKFKRVS